MAKTTTVLYRQGGQKVTSMPFKFGMAAMARFNEMAGLNFLQLDNIGMHHLLMMIVCGLNDGERAESEQKRRRQRIYTLEEVGDMMDVDPGFLDECQNAMKESNPGMFAAANADIGTEESEKK